ncbi:uncharacterized protein [Aquarana catesbeiana]|uniref:uncharacterized protein n=1 Tax=Aquarana catesbeiana TaxID=8400 RepID=UPI003CC961B4
MSPSSVFPGFHTGRSHHPSLSSGRRGTIIDSYDLSTSMFVTINVLLYIHNGNLEDDNIDVKEEFKEEDEEYGVMEFSDGNKDMMEPPNTRNPPERCPRPLYSRDSTQEDHTIPHHYKNTEFEVKSEEEEETYVRGDQQSMEEDGISGTFIEEDTPTEISTGGSLILNTFLHPYCSLICPEKDWSLCCTLHTPDTRPIIPSSLSLL